MNTNAQQFERGDEGAVLPLPHAKRKSSGPRLTKKRLDEMLETTRRGAFDRGFEAGQEAVSVVAEFAIGGIVGATCMGLIWWVLR